MLDLKLALINFLFCHIQKYVYHYTFGTTQKSDPHWYFTMSTPGDTRDDWDGDEDAMAGGHGLYNEVCFKGYDQSMSYIPTFHTITKRFCLA
jgi:hypothetical protein